MSSKRITRTLNEMLDFGHGITLVHSGALKPCRGIRRVFDTCERVEIAAKPGEAYVAHRLVLHGVAPWAESATAGEEGRMICYFRPISGGPKEWLTAP